MNRRFFWLINGLIFSGMAGASQATGVDQLSLSSDYCAILRAFTQEPDSRCPSAPENGASRSVNLHAAQPIRGTEAGYFIQFSLNSDVLSEDYLRHLDQLSDVLRSEATNDLCLRVIGHADTSGTVTHNQDVSVRRARAVQLYLVGVHTLNQARINFSGKGETNPLPDVAGTDPLNRRVELLAKPSGEDACS